MGHVVINASLALIFSAAMGSAEKPHAEFSGAGGTLAIFVPTSTGLVIAADMRQSPHGVFCDGINKILLPHRPRTAVVVTGNITLQDTSNIPKAELCDYLAKNRAPIDFGRSALEFLDSTTAPFAELNWAALTDQIYQSIVPYIKAGNLSPFFGTEIAQIIFAEFERDTQSSKLLSLTVNLDSAGNFTLQPVRVTAATTIRGDSFNLDSDRQILPFGEVPYYQQHVVAGVGKQFLTHDYFDLVAKSKVADVDPGLASAAAVNLISAASKATEIVAAPSGIGGGESAVLLGSETQVLR
ncbi:MAG: hypothetical protein QHD01_29230 [Bradyrhizobium sp.]|uniref:hypothetical protein n=1 Tax=Bradyrhizobium sp. TaxID=376 RepID=UPI0029A33EDC|nr:hypothetical protein [Bradyrhizobium sp.]MDX3970652.1 hypothetical protein [Bradyrhizobium sp.]